MKQSILALNSAWRARGRRLWMDEHAGCVTAGVVHAVAVRFDYLNRQLHHAAQGVELATLLALGAGESGELGEEAFIGAPQHIPDARCFVAIN